LSALMHSKMTEINNKLHGEQDDYTQISRRDFCKLSAMAGFIIVGCWACQSTQSTSETIPSKVKFDFSQLSFCGLNCKEACPEYAYPKTCEGCKSKGGKCAPYCCGCPVRGCASEKGILTCAHCDEFPTCDKDTWKTYPRLRSQIEQLRVEIKSQP
jgi:hypothetical protein